MIVRRVRIRGFAPPGLVAGLRGARWVYGRHSVEGCFFNFEAIGLGGYCLTTPPDSRASAHFAVTVAEAGTAERFEVEGYGFPSIPHAMLVGPPAFKENRILGHKLEPAIAEGLVEYFVELVG